MYFKLYSWQQFEHDELDWTYSATTGTSGAGGTGIGGSGSGAGAAVAALPSDRLTFEFEDLRPDDPNAETQTA